MLSHTGGRLHKGPTKEVGPHVPFSSSNGEWLRRPNRQLTATNCSQVGPLPLELREHLHQLRLILLVITGAVVTLRRQNADFDADVAYDLTEQVCRAVGL